MSTGPDSKEKSDRKLGRLTMAATHLGNPLDIPVRTLEAMRSADLVIFEEDKPARRVLKAAGVHREWLRFSEHNQKDTIAALKSCLKKGGWVAYASDQGTPGFADPGQALVQAALDCRARIDVVPGPSSVAAAVAACPFDCRRFTFMGFLPRENSARQRVLTEAAALPHPLIMMDTPYRLQALVSACAGVFGKKRRGFLALDISGEFEAYHSGSFEQLVELAPQLPPKVNFILIAGAPG